MRLRNNIFAAALDELKRREIIKTQKDLAKLMGVSEDTITRILKDRTDVTEDVITKLQTASGCIFNLQWLRGEDPYHMLISDLLDDPDFGKSAAEPHESAPIDADFYHKTLDLNAQIISDLRKDLEYFKQLVLDQGSTNQYNSEQFVELQRQASTYAAELQYQKQLVADVRRALDDKLSEIQTKSDLIKMQADKIADLEMKLAKANNDLLHEHPFPIGVADDVK